MAEEPKNNNAAADSSDEAKKQIEALQKERDEYLNGWKRAKADLLNYKKEDERRFAEVTLFSNQTLVKELLNVLDSFDLALASPAMSEAEKKGIMLIKSQLEEIMKRQGLTRIAVKPGEHLDSNLHEAIAEVECKENKELVGKIVGELVAGYRLGGKVIRPSKVKIGK